MGQEIWLNLLYVIDREIPRQHKPIANCPGARPVESCRVPDCAPAQNSQSAMQQQCLPEFQVPVALVSATSLIKEQFFQTAFMESPLCLLTMLLPRWRRFAC